MKEGALYTAWSPDSRLLVFMHIEKTARITGYLRFLDVSKGTFSDTVSGALLRNCGWGMGGIAWSPDGRYLVYPGLLGESIQLFAARIDTAANHIKGKPLQITSLEVGERPCFPSFTRDGKQLSYGIYGRNWDIYLMDFHMASKRISGPSIAVATDMTWDGDFMAS